MLQILSFLFIIVSAYLMFQVTYTGITAKKASLTQPIRLWVVCLVSIVLVNQFV